MEFELVGISIVIDLPRSRHLYSPITRIRKSVLSHMLWQMDRVLHFVEQIFTTRILSSLFFLPFSRIPRTQTQPSFFLHTLFSC